MWIVRTAEARASSDPLGRFSDFGSRLFFFTTYPHGDLASEVNSEPVNLLLGRGGVGCEHQPFFFTEVRHVNLDFH